MHVARIALQAFDAIRILGLCEELLGYGLEIPLEEGVLVLEMAIEGGCSKCRLGVLPMKSAELW